MRQDYDWRVMAKAAHRAYWWRLGKMDSPWDALTTAERQAWEEAVRAALTAYHAPPGGKRPAGDRPSGSG